MKMRHITIVAIAALLAACGPSEPDVAASEPSEPPAETEVASETEPSPQPLPEPEPEAATASYNEEVWYISGGWPGEYPPGFSVLDENVTLMGRKFMHEDEPKVVTCRVPQNATYQLWNSGRVESDNLEFVTVSERLEITINTDTTVDAPTDEDFTNTLDLKAGDVLTYLRYVGEGWAVMEHELTEYQIEENSLNGVSDVDKVFDGSKKDYLWAQISCADDARTRAWLLFDEVIKTEGMVMSPITGFGESARHDGPRSRRCRCANGVLPGRTSPR